jgi:uncharacterized membrane protein
MTEFPAITVGLSLCGGIVLGCGYFAMLYKALQLHAAAAPIAPIVMLHALRGLLAVAAFWGLVQIGAWPLLAGLAGFGIARTAAQQLVRRL